MKKKNLPPGHLPQAEGAAAARRGPRGRVDHLLGVDAPAAPEVHAHRPARRRPGERGDLRAVLDSAAAGTRAPAGPGGGGGRSARRRFRFRFGARRRGGDQGDQRQPLPPEGGDRGGLERRRGQRRHLHFRPRPRGASGLYGLWRQEGECGLCPLVDDGEPVPRGSRSFGPGGAGGGGSEPRVPREGHERAERQARRGSSPRRRRRRRRRRRGPLSTSAACCKARHLLFFFHKGESGGRGREEKRRKGLEAAAHREGRSPNGEIFFSFPPRSSFSFSFSFSFFSHTLLLSQLTGSQSHGRRGRRSYPR
jgi:hypothetical protein